MKRSEKISGLWKFRDSVTIDELGALAKEWAQDDRYEQLYIRGCSKDQNGIGFVYNISDSEDTKEAQRAYGEETSDMLKRRFGNDLAGWDYASPTYEIK